VAFGYLPHSGIMVEAIERGINGYFDTSVGLPEIAERGVQQIDRAECLNYFQVAG